MGSNFTLCDSDFFALGHKFSSHNGDLYGTAINFVAKFERLLECIVWIKFSRSTYGRPIRMSRSKVKFSFRTARVLKINFIYLIDIYAVFG